MSFASFRDVQYIPDTLFQAVKAKLSRELHHPTEFYLDSQQIDEAANPFFKRYVADQQFIRAVNQGNPVLAHLWRWSSDMDAVWGFGHSGLFSWQFCLRLLICRS